MRGMSKEELINHAAHDLDTTKRLLESTQRQLEAALEGITSEMARTALLAELFACLAAEEEDVEQEEK